ncbi:hypothetical protein [Pseudomonas sp. 37 R 15]|nr:hypothetical protein [Pseudomonas sp. 37 R 15]
MLAKNVNDNACFLNERGACEFFASKLAPAKSQGKPRPTFARLCFEDWPPLGTITALSHSPKEPPCPGLNCSPPHWG